MLERTRRGFLRLFGIGAATAVAAPEALASALDAPSARVVQVGKILPPVPGTHFTFPPPSAIDASLGEITAGRIDRTFEVPAIMNARGDFFDLNTGELCVHFDEQEMRAAEERRMQALRERIPFLKKPHARFRKLPSFTRDWA